MSSGQFESAAFRQGGGSFIDEVCSSPSSPSGSSVSEEEEVPDSTEVCVTGMRDYDILDNFRARRPVLDQEDEDQGDFDESIETEDWELADGGEAFTHVAKPRFHQTVQPGETALRCTQYGRSISTTHTCAKCSPQRTSKDNDTGS